ncbi:MAG: hypothetical protein LBE09_00580 [Christensenellaceae bacterium]|nr:hypothetical protein [Christensenellaceae bacterium]
MSKCVRYGVIVFLLSCIIMFSGCVDEAKFDAAKTKMIEYGYVVSDKSAHIEPIEAVGLTDVFYITHASQPHVHAAVLLFDSESSVDLIINATTHIVARNGKIALYAIVRKGGTGSFDKLIADFDSATK